MNKSKKIKKNNLIKYEFTKSDFESNDGMLTSVWGPGLWHYLHSMSFNFPNNPTDLQKKKYKQFIENLKFTLPCKYCRINLVKNLKIMPLKECHLSNRKMFSYYIYKLHEHINHMLGKKSGLSYQQVRNRYENFRARCTESEFKNKLIKSNHVRTIKKKREKGCTVPLYGKKAKSIIKIVPQDQSSKSIIIDKKCLRYTKKIK